MKRFSQLSIKHKMFWVILLAISIPLFIAGFLISTSEKKLIDHMLNSELKILTTIFAAESSAALLFDDPEHAATILQTLKHQPVVINACLYRHTRELFTQYTKVGQAPCAPLRDNEITGSESAVKRYYSQSVIIDDTTIGYLDINTSLMMVNTLRAQQNLILVCILFLFSITALVIGWYLQRLITKPLENISEAAKEIAMGNINVRAPISDSEDEITEMAHSFNVMVNTMINQHYRNERNLAQYTAIFENNPDLLFVIGEDARIISANKTALSKLYLSLNDLRHRSIYWLTYADYQDHMRRLLENPHISQADTVIIPLRSNSMERPIWVNISLSALPDDEGSQRLLLNCQDITEPLELSKRIEYQTYYDDLTDLPNRKSFQQEIDKALLSLDDFSLNVLAYADLDHFRIINESVGHTAGDQYLRQIAQKFASLSSNHITVARLGGDEFGFLILNSHPKAVNDILEQVTSMVRNFSQHVDEEQFNFTISIGYIHLTTKIQSSSEAFSLADIACSIAKSNGGDLIKHLAEDANETRNYQSMLHVTSQLRQHFANGRFELFCQPIFSLTEENSHYAEILIRMKDNNGKYIPAHSFVTAIENHGKAVELDRWVVLNTFQWLANHAQSNTQISINLSSQSLCEIEVCEEIIVWMKQYTIEPQKICFEITETGYLRNAEIAAHFIQKIKQQGCLIALDDFGSGFASYEYLKKFPVDVVKIDGSFIKNIVHTELDQSIVKSIIQLAHDLNLKVVAEWVEDKAIYNYLKNLNVDYGQGYYLGKPIPLIEYVIEPAKKPSK